MSDDWKTLSNVYDLGQLLVQQGKFDQETWRMFHCKCLRNVWHLIRDETVKRAIEAAEGYCQGEVSVEELDRQHEAVGTISRKAWEVLLSLRTSQKSNEYVWPISRQDVDDVWIGYSSAIGASVVTQREIDALATPEAACSIYAWATARRDIIAKGGNLNRDSVEAQWKANRDAEEQKQADLLRSMFPRPSTTDNRSGA
ncbi:MAG: hypothetical protein WD845_10125 [Pirellulales bacterium]